MADVITGEAVALELPVANFPSRIAALLIDMAVQIVLLLRRRHRAGDDVRPAQRRLRRRRVRDGLRPGARRLSDGVRDPEQGQDARQDGARHPGRWRRRQPGAIPAGACARAGRRTRDLDHRAGPGRTDHVHHLGQRQARRRHVRRDLRHPGAGTSPACRCRPSSPPCRRRWRAGLRRFRSPGCRTRLPRRRVATSAGSVS